MTQTHSNAEKRSRFARHFAGKVISYVAVCSFLTFVNWYTSPHDWWVVWVIAGWGLGLALSLLKYLFDCNDDEKQTNN